ncbi:hypothetical protein H0H93_000344 [Arthromyces matolae]|nr:hypothetical protein H0H93_000344 [Arthromyces matolae]
MFLRRLTTNTVAKPSQDENPYDMTEARALNWLFINTPVPIPRVRRIVDCYIIMDYIPGKELSSVWTTLSTWKKIYIAFTLRRYLRRIHRIKSSPTTPPGPISTRGPLRCESPIFRMRSPRGPFNSYSDLATWFNERNITTWDQKPIPLDDPKRKNPFDDSQPLVLTHQDLNLHNIILGEDGQVWIIDWAWAGYYPPWFEYVTMKLQNKNLEQDGPEYGL